MTTTTSTRTFSRRWAVLLLAVLAAVLALVLPASTASANGLSAAQTRVGVSTLAAPDVVGVAEHIAAGQRRSRAPSQLRLVSGHCVAAEAGSGARFVVGAGGETTMFLRAGTESLEVTEHAALRMTQRGISIDAAESTLGQPSFQYFHQGVWKTGYYDPSSRIFIGTVDGRLTTVINNASPNYIANLQAATP